ncbi:peptide chain release factor N(5)-glutamine methyltransferase [Leucobacter sp. HY1910]
MASDPRSLQYMLAALCDQFSQAGIDTPEADAELLAGHVLGVSRGRVQALAIMGSTLEGDDAARLEALAAQRADRVPLQHLTGRAAFRTLELQVGPGVFVPRPETELLAQLAIDELRGANDAVALDLCTGSGAVALALAQEVPGARVWAVEKSVEAHAWATRNVAEWGDGRVTLLLGDVAELDPKYPAGPVVAPASAVARAILPLAGRVTVLASNPPYVPAAAIPRDPEVREHDPDLALYGGEDGLDVIRVLSRVGRHLVAPGGLIALEHAEEQGAAIRRLLERDGWTLAQTHLDLTGRDRVTTARAVS